MSKQVVIVLIFYLNLFESKSTMMKKLIKKVTLSIYYENLIGSFLVIYWSQRLTSDSIIPVIQQIMDNQHVFTLWEKTAMFYGYFKVTSFTSEAFTVSQDRINQILEDEIRYIENLSIPEEKTQNFMKNIDEFIANKQETELGIIYCKYPYKLDIKISLFGRKKIVQKTKNKLQAICHKHTLKTIYLKFTDDQVNLFFFSLNLKKKSCILV